MNGDGRETQWRLSALYSVHPIPLNKQDVEEVLLLVGVVATSEPERRAR